MYRQDKQLEQHFQECFTAVNTQTIESSFDPVPETPQEEGEPEPLQHHIKKHMEDAKKEVCLVLTLSDGARA